MTISQQLEQFSTSRSKDELNIEFEGNVVLTVSLEQISMDDLDEYASQLESATQVDWHTCRDYISCSL